MANVIRKIADTNGIFHYVPACQLVDYPSADWLQDPDVSALSAVSRNYWKVSGSTVIEMTQPEKDAVDAALNTVATTGLDAEIFVDEQTYTAGETKTIILPNAIPNMVVHANDPVVSELTNSSLLSPAGTGWDPHNRSNSEGNLNNGSYSDLAYNNTSASNTSGFILGIDMGSPTTINAMKMWDYNTTYYNTAWEFIGTDDISGSPENYTVIFTHAQSSAYLDPDPYLRTFTDQTFRYYGIRVVTSNNATYSIWRELELYTGTLTDVEKELTKKTDFNVSKIDDTTVEITNLRATSQTIKVVIVGR